MQQRYKELEEQKQARKTIFVDKLTVPTKGKAARGRNGGMTIVRAGHQMRKFVNACPCESAANPASYILGIVIHAFAWQGYLWQSSSRGTTCAGRENSCVRQIRSSCCQSTSTACQTSFTITKTIRESLDCQTATAEDRAWSSNTRIEGYKAK